MGEQRGREQRPSGVDNGERISNRVGGAGERVEAQMQVRYGAMQYRAGNEVYGSVLGRGAEVLRGLKGDIGMVNRERKGVGGGEVGGELGRLGRAWEAGVRKNLVLEGLLRAEGEKEGCRMIFGAATSVGRSTGTVLASRRSWMTEVCVV